MLWSTPAPTLTATERTVRGRGRPCACLLGRSIVCSRPLHNAADVELRRGVPLSLSAPRYAALSQLVREHRVATEVTWRRMSAEQVYIQGQL